MKSKPTLTKLATVCLAVACFAFGVVSAVAGDLETNILSFPDIAFWKYRPDLAVASANALISAGKENACAALEKAGLDHREEINQNICLLCRLLFVSTNSNQCLRPPMIGDPRLLGHEFKMSDWPDLPFVIVDNMPLSITEGYMLEGTPELSWDYLAYCEENGAFRTELYSKPSALSISNALDQVFHSTQWQSIPWDAFGRPALANLDSEQSSNVVENSVKDQLRQQAANIVKNEK